MTVPPLAASRVRAIPPVRRYVDETQRWTSLTADDRALLDGVLRNEVDMAYRRRARILLDYLALRDGERVLDCGCGMGFYLLAMAQLRRLRLVGLDGDPERLAWARREGIPAALLRGDLQQLPFASASFDKVLATEVLEHVRDDTQMLAELFRILRPGGILAISVPHARYPFWWDPIHRVWTGLGGAPIRSGPIVGMWTYHERLYEPQQVAERVLAAGFDVAQLEETTHFSVPLSHFLVYGIGKPLIEHNLLPGPLRRSADRLSGQQNRGSKLNPINLGRAVFRAVDDLNERPAVARADTFVNVLLKAHKPSGA
jgi:ubiquinone/menaquinone biosynthesis C-methylase UbiE